jgi:hypothetical protein
MEGRSKNNEFQIKVNDDSFTEADANYEITKLNEKSRSDWKRREEDLNFETDSIARTSIRRGESVSSLSLSIPKAQLAKLEMEERRKLGRRTGSIIQNKKILSSLKKKPVAEALSKRIAEINSDHKYKKELSFTMESKLNKPKGRHHSQEPSFSKYTTSSSTSSEPTGANSVRSKLHLLSSTLASPNRKLRPDLAFLGTPASYLSPQIRDSYRAITLSNRLPSLFHQPPVTCLLHPHNSDLLVPRKTRTKIKKNSKDMTQNTKIDKNGQK